MARLYNGFDALALGQAVNGLYGNMAARKANGIQVLGDSLKEMLQAREQEQKEAARRQSAIDYLTGTGGMDNAKATQMVDTVTPEQAVLYLTGRLDKKADTEDERGYEQAIHDRNRGEQISDRNAEWAHDFEDWMKKNGITYDQSIESSMFNKYVDLLMSNDMHDWGNSIRGIQQRNAIIDAITDYTEKHPKYNGAWEKLKTVYGEKGDLNNGLYDEPMADKLRELGGKNHTDQEREEYLKYLRDNDKFHYVMNNDYFNDAKSAFIENVNNNKLMPYVNLQKLIGTNTTQEQRNKDIKNAKRAARMKSVKEQIQLARRGKAEWPTLSKDEIEELKKDKTFAQMIKNRY